MRKKIRNKLWLISMVVPILTAVGILLIISEKQSSVSSAATVTVCASGCDYTALDSAISGVVSGDTINITQNLDLGLSTVTVPEAKTGLTIVCQAGVQLTSSNSSTQWLVADGPNTTISNCTFTAPTCTSVSSAVVQLGATATDAVFNGNVISNLSEQGSQVTYGLLTVFAPNASVDDNTISNTCSGSKVGVMVSNNGNISITNNVINHGDSSYQAVYLRSSFADTSGTTTVTGNQFNMSCESGCDTYTYALHIDNTAINPYSFVVNNNDFISTNQSLVGGDRPFGILVTDEASAVGGADTGLSVDIIDNTFSYLGRGVSLQSNHLTEVNVTNNSFYQVSWMIGDSSTLDLDNLVIRNNLSYCLRVNQNCVGLWLNGTVDSYDIDYNMLFGYNQDSGGDKYLNTNIFGLTIGNNSTVTYHPAYVDPENNDFSLAPYSHAIGYAADNSDLGAVPFDGDVRQTIYVDDDCDIDRTATENFCDYNTINEALDAAQEGGYAINVAAGTYVERLDFDTSGRTEPARITEPPLASNKFVRIVGEGSDVVNLDVTGQVGEGGGADVIIIDGFDGLAISGMSLAADLGTFITVQNGADNNIFSDIALGGYLSGPSIKVNNADGNSFSDMTFTAAAYGVKFMGTANDNSVTDSTFAVDGTANVLNESSSSNNIANCDFSTSSVTGSGSVDVYYKVRGLITDPDTSDPTVGATVTFNDVTDVEQFVDTTDGTGYTDYSDYLLTYRIITGGSVVNVNNDYEMVVTGGVGTETEIFTLDQVNETVAVTYQMVPNAPTVCATTAITFDSATIGWTDNSGNEQGFAVEKSVDNSTWSTVATTAANAVTQGVTSLSPSTQYYFRIKSFIGGTGSTYLNCTAFTTLVPASTVEPCQNCTVVASPPTAPTALAPVSLSSTSIQWNFVDTANDEVGFRLWNVQNSQLMEQIQPNLTNLVETGLIPNTQYHRYVSAYNNNGNSSLAEMASVFTKAAIPTLSNPAFVNANTATVNLSANGNPTTTTAVVFEGNSGKYVQADGSLGDLAVYRAFSDWGPTITIAGLTPATEYKFQAKAKNGSGEETIYSDLVTVSTEAPKKANIVLTKMVGVNVSGLVYNQVFGLPIASASTTGKIIDQLPMYSSVLNVYIGLALAMVIIFLLLLLINANAKLKNYLHIPSIIFKDFKGKNGDYYFELLHSREAEKRGLIYSFHHRYYKYTTLGLTSLILGVAAKALMVILIMASAYGTVSVSAFADENGDDVTYQDTLTYRVDYLNNGLAEAKELVVKDTVPAGTTFVAGSLNDSSKCSVALGLITCNYGSVASGANGFLEFKVKVTGAVGATITNSATASYVGMESVSSNAVSNEIIVGQGVLVACNDGKDNDGDGLVDLADADCSSVTDTSEAPSGPVCGDNKCNGIETCTTCSTDCGICAPQVVCGDNVCDVNENINNCPQDCRPQAVCGDNICSPGENCPSDCLIKEPAAICGDKICSARENVNNCPVDCLPPVTGPVCGDNLCNGDETCSSCQADCGECQVPVVISGDGGGFCGDDICNVDLGETCNSCSADCTECSVDKVTTELDKLDDDLAVLNLIDSQGEGAELKEVDVQKIEENIERIIDSAEVQLVAAQIDKKDEWNKTDKERSLEATIDAEKFVRSDSVKTFNKVVASVVSGVTRQDVRVVEKQVAKATKNVVKTTIAVKQNTIDNRVVEKVNDVAKEPAVATVTATSVASVATVGVTGTSGASALTYLQFLFTQPLMMVMRKRRKGWGTIYNSVTKKPVDLAIVRVYDEVTGLLVRTKVTDKLGRYQFIMKPGKYYIEVSKKEYTFPSRLLEKRTEDGEYQDLYYGGQFEVGEKGAVRYAIAMDPNRKLESTGSVLKKYLLKKWQYAFVLIGPIIACMSFVINPDKLVGVLALAQIAVFYLFKRLADKDEPISYGLVMDKINKSHLGQAVVRVFDTKFNKLLETQVTDRKGRYSFLVGKDKYYLTSERSGYQAIKTPVYDLQTEKEGLLAVDIVMDKIGIGGGVSAVAVASRFNVPEPNLTPKPAETKLNDSSNNTIIIDDK